MNLFNETQRNFIPHNVKRKQEKKKILIIEDDFDTRELMKEAIYDMKDLNVKVVSAFNGLEGLSYLALHNDIDLIILDLKMPAMSGEDFLAALQLSKQNTFTSSSILIASASELGRSIANEFKTSFIAKPFGVNKLICKVQSLLNRVRNNY